MTRFGSLVKLTLAISIGFLLVSGCGGSSSSSDTPVGGGETTTAYNGPGSKWDVSLSGGDFTITRRPELASAVDMTVTGTYEDLASGFLKLTVSSSEGEDGPTQGDMAWALEVPGYAFFLRPIEAGSEQIIPMVTAGECPTSDVDANWVMVRKDSDAMADDPERDFFGAFHYDAASDTATLPVRRALGNNFQDQGGQDLVGGTCADGIMEVDDAVMYLTSNGGAIVHTGLNRPDDGSFIFALSQKNITSVANLDGEYAGVLFDDNLASGDKIAPVSLSCTAGMCSGSLVADIETGELDEGSVAVNLTGTTDEFSPGLISGEIVGEGTGAMACMADVDVLDTGRSIVSCVGQSPGDVTKMFNVIFVSVGT